MNKNNLTFKNCIQKKYLKNDILKKLSKLYQSKILEVSNEIESSQKTLSILSSKFKFNFDVKDLSRFKLFNTIVIIGMGGSILGSEAIYGFLKKKIKKNLYFIDNLDEEKIKKLKTKENFSKVLFLIISKSGNTIETLSNSFALKIIKKNSKNIIIISEKKNNLLFSLSKKLNLFYIEHRNYIGGRYSVLSEVGMVPAYLMGLNINKFRSNIFEFNKSKEKKFLNESVIKLSNLLLSKKINNLVFLCYSPEIENFLYWCQQLISESLGKKGKGFLPIVSINPKDHHSMLQLYLDGPKDKLFNIFSVENKSSDTINIYETAGIKTYLKKKSLRNIKIAQKKALILVLKKNKIPFREFTVNKIDEEILGKLFSYFILETILIGKIIKVNPFDQPAVEQVKFFTKKLLS